MDCMGYYCDSTFEQGMIRGVDWEQNLYLTRITFSFEIVLFGDGKRLGKGASSTGTVKGLQTVGSIECD